MITIAHNYVNLVATTEATHQKTFVSTLNHLMTNTWSWHRTKLCNGWHKWWWLYLSRPVYGVVLANVMELETKTTNHVDDIVILFMFWKVGDRKRSKKVLSVELIYWFKIMHNETKKKKKTLKRANSTYFCYDESIIKLPWMLSACAVRHNPWGGDSHVSNRWRQTTSSRVSAPNTPVSPSSCSCVASTRAGPSHRIMTRPQRSSCGYASPKPPPTRSSRTRHCAYVIWRLFLLTFIAGLLQDLI